MKTSNILLGRMFINLREP